VSAPRSRPCSFSAYLLKALFSAQSAGGTQGSNAQGGRGPVRLPAITLQDLARLMSVGAATRIGNNRVTIQPEDEEDEEDDGDYMEEDDEDVYSPSHQSTQWFPPVTEPQQAGLDLLASGEFGRVGVKHRTRRNNLNISRSVLNQFYQPIPIPSREDTQSVCSYHLEDYRSITLSIYNFTESCS
jgi:WD repeat-containing protein 23